MLKAGYAQPSLTKFVMHQQKMSGRYLLSIANMLMRKPLSLFGQS